MIRTVSLYTHNVQDETWEALVAVIEKAVENARHDPDGSVGGYVYDSSRIPSSRPL